MPLPPRPAEFTSQCAGWGVVARIFWRASFSVVLWALLGSGSDAQAQAESSSTTPRSSEPAPIPPSTSAFLSVHGGDVSCPTQRALEKRVLEIIEREGGIAPGARFSVEFSSAGRGWRAEVRAAGSAKSTFGIRRIESKSPDCADTLQPVALVLALLLDSRSDQTESPPVAELPEVTPTERLGVESWHGELTAQLEVGVGTMPELSAGPGLGLWVHAPRQISFNFRSHWFPQQRMEAEKGGVAIGDASFALGLCMRWEWELWHWPLCGFGEAERVRLSGFGFDQNLAASELVPRLGASTGFRVGIFSRTFVRGDYGVSLGLARYRAVWRDDGGADRVVFVQSRWASFLSLGVGVEFF